MLSIFDHEVYTIGANDENAQDVIRGLTAGLVYGDEITLWPESAFRTVLGRMSPKGAKFIGTTNPDSPFHWLKADFLDRDMDSDREDKLLLKRWSFRLEDNLTLDPIFVQEIKKEYTGFWYDRFIEGKWCVAEGRIYQGFTPETNVFPNAILPELNLAMFHLNKFAHMKPDEQYVSIDYGTGNPTVFGFWWKIKDTFVLMREWRHENEKQQKTDNEFAYDLQVFTQTLRDQSLLGIADNRLPVYVDRTAASFKQQLKKTGFTMTLNSASDVLDGIRTVDSFFQSKHLFVHNSCKGVLSEVESYVWDAKKQERGEDAPLKRNDHSMDMLRYGVYSLVKPLKGGTVLGRF